MSARYGRGQGHRADLRPDPARRATVRDLFVRLDPVLPPPYPDGTTFTVMITDVNPATGTVTDVLGCTVTWPAETCTAAGPVAVAEGHYLQVPVRVPSGLDSGYRGSFRL